MVSNDCHRAGRERDMRRAKKQSEPLMEWLQSIPVDDNVDVVGTVRIELPVSEWLVIREASLYSGRTMEEVIAATLRESDYLMEMSTPPLSK